MKRQGESVTDKKVFKIENIMDSAAPTPNGSGSGSGGGNFIDELNLPPTVADFLTIWYRHLLAGLVLLLVVILGWVFSQQYISGRENRASEQLSVAMGANDSLVRVAALNELIAKYPRTGAGLWGRIELAHQAREAGEMASAVQAYEELLPTLSRLDPRRPMVQLSLAQALVELKRYDQAAAVYLELETIVGFEAWGLLGSGDMLARRGDMDAAWEKYRQVVAMENVARLLRAQALQRLR